MTFVQSNFDKFLLAGLFLTLLFITVFFAFYLKSPDGYKDFTLQSGAAVLGALLQALRGGSKADRKEAPKPGPTPKKG